MQYYYIDSNDIQCGPVLRDQLVALGVTPETFVWKEGMTDWQQAKFVEDLNIIWYNGYYNLSCSICRLEDSAICKDCKDGSLFSLCESISPNRVKKNIMTYNECSYCRRAGSYLCNGCKDANLLLINDTRQIYYINSEEDSPKGPVAVYLLPYCDVWPESYVWMTGMKDWDFAGNILDRRVLSLNFKYCPCCNGVFEGHLIYPDDSETVYRCKNCGFEFSYGATRMCSEAQKRFSEFFYENTI